VKSRCLSEPLCIPDAPTRAKAPARVSPRRDAHVRRSQVHQARPDRSGLCAQYGVPGTGNKPHVRGEDGASARALARGGSHAAPAGAAPLAVRERCDSRGGRATASLQFTSTRQPCSDRCCSRMNSATHSVARHDDPLTMAAIAAAHLNTKSAHSERTLMLLRKRYKQDGAHRSQLTDAAWRFWCGVRGRAGVTSIDGRCR